MAMAWPRCQLACCGIHCYPDTHPRPATHPFMASPTRMRVALLKRTRLKHGEGLQVQGRCDPPAGRMGLAKRPSRVVNGSPAVGFP